MKDYLCDISRFNFSMNSAAASLPPNPKAKPPAIATIANSAVKSVWMSCVATLSCSKAANKANTIIAHLLIAAIMPPLVKPAACTEAKTVRYTKLAKTTAITKIKAATTTFGTYESTESKKFDTSCKPKISVAAKRVTITKNHLKICPTSIAILRRNPACSTARFKPLR